MADLRAATKALLEGDATLGALTSNILDRNEVGEEGLKLANLRTGSSPVIVPSVYIKWVSENPLPNSPSLPDGSVVGVRAFCEIYFYGDSNYTTITAMRRRVYGLLHQKRVTVDTDYVYAFLWRGDVLEQKDMLMGGVCVERSRYEVHYLRR